MKAATGQPPGAAHLKTGLEAEQRACDHLCRQGLRLVARQYRCRLGEIDLVMRDGDHLVFVEVRARRGEAYGGAAASITASKRRRIILAARHYLASHCLDAPCRFDVVLLQDTRIEWLKAAFDA